VIEGNLLHASDLGGETPPTVAPEEVVNLPSTKRQPITYRTGRYVSGPECRQHLIRQIFVNSKLSTVEAIKGAPARRPAMASASGWPNSRAASAEASTMLTAVTIGADQLGCLSGRPQAKPTYFAHDLSGARAVILLNGRFYNSE